MRTLSGLRLEGPSESVLSSWGDEDNTTGRVAQWRTHCDDFMCSDTGWAPHPPTASGVDLAGRGQIQVWPSQAVCTGRRHYSRRCLAADA
jgi:hypothetical protein